MQNEGDKKKERQTAQALAMTAERTAIIQQRKENPKLAKEESDMSKMVAFNQVINWIPRHWMDAGEFLALKQKTVRVTNVGRSTAYYFVAVNQTSIDDPGTMLTPAP